MRLCSSAVSSNGKRVRVCAAELGVAVEPVVIDFQREENRAPAYLALNPMGMAPTLTDGDFALWESAAILWYLARGRGGPLSPDGPREEADVLRWLFFCSCHVDPHVNVLVFERHIKARRGEAPDDALVNAARRALARFVPVVDAQLAGRDHLTGRFGLADIALGCSLELAPMLDLDLAPHANVRRWLAALAARPSWRGPSPTVFLDR